MELDSRIYTLSRSYESVSLVGCAKWGRYVTWQSSASARPVLLNQTSGCGRKPLAFTFSYVAMDHRSSWRHWALLPESGGVTVYTTCCTFTALRSGKASGQ